MHASTTASFRQTRATLNRVAHTLDLMDNADRAASVRHDTALTDELVEQIANEVRALRQEVTQIGKELVELRLDIQHAAQRDQRR